MPIHLKVSTDLLQRKAEEIQEQIEQVEIDLEEYRRIIEIKKNYWKGEAGNIHQNYFKSFQEDLPIIVKRLKEHPIELMKMAGVYQEAETRAMEISMALPEDIIK